MTDQVAATELSLEDLTLEDAIEDLKHPPLVESALPGLAITKYRLYDIQEWSGWQYMAEPYLFGIAVDSTLRPVKIPWGLEIVDPNTFSLPKVAADVNVTFGNADGAPLVLPPVHDFLALVLMVADSDNAKATAEVLKAISGLATNADLIKAAAGADPRAGALLALIGGILNVTVAGIENNRDDVIATFAAYFGPSKLTSGAKFKLSRPGADAWLKVLED